MYLGTLVDMDVRTAVMNERSLCLYADSAASRNLPVKDPEKFIISVRDEVQREFGTHVTVDFFDAQLGEVMEQVDKNSAFHLWVSISNVGPHSRVMH
jgi:hypothetical protein